MARSRTLIELDWVGTKKEEQQEKERFIHPFHCHMKKKLVEKLRDITSDFHSSTELTLTTQYNLSPYAYHS